MDFLKKIKSNFELGVRIFVWAMLFAYGSGKILGGQFYRYGNLPDNVANMPISEVGGFDLAWTFFGYSEGYIWFIGISQLIGAFMLLSNRTKLLGVAILIPILLNIIVVDFFFEVSTGAMLSAVGYLLGLAYIAYCDRDRVIATWNAIIKSPDRKESKNTISQKAIQLGVAIGLSGIFLLLQTQMLNIVGY